MILGDDFNPHSREGSDHIFSGRLPRSVDFNPHSREGSDEGYLDSNMGKAISIHTPARGVTLLVGAQTGRESVFQSTLPRGE